MRVLSIRPQVAGVMNKYYSQHFNLCMYACLLCTNKSSLTQVPLPSGLKMLHLWNCTFVPGLVYNGFDDLDLDEEVIEPIKKHLPGWWSI